MSELSHLDAEGRARMVNVGDKPVTARVCVARGAVRMAAETLDKIKSLSYRFASQSGLTISIDDVRTPSSKAAILDEFEQEAERVENQFRRGVITDGERRQKEVEIWTEATEQVTEAMKAELSSSMFNPIDMMVGSGARGNMMQVRQIAGNKFTLYVVPRALADSSAGIHRRGAQISTPCFAAGTRGLCQ